MTTGAYKNISGLTHELEVSLWDYNDDGEAVWRGSISGQEDRFVEGHVDDDVWSIMEKLLKAFDEEDK